MKPISILMYVPNVAEAAIWYTNAFNCTEPCIPLSSEHKCLILESITLEFVPADNKVKSGAAGSVVYWSVESVSVEIDRLEKMGAKLYRGPMVIENDEVMCQVKDPFGNLFGMRGPS